MVDTLDHLDILNHMVSDQSIVLDRVFHALAHPARRKILRQLSDRERSLGELATPLKMSFPAASKHVRVLERAALVRRRIVGRTHLCRLHSDPLQHAAKWIENYRRQWEAKFEVLDDLLTEMQSKPAKTVTKQETKHARGT
jgi:DNA-binding transcriptional ArsR family regulator